MRISAIKTGAAKRIMNRMRGNDFAAMVPPFSNCFLRKSLGVAHPRKTHVSIAATGSMMLVAMLSRKSKMFMPSMDIWLSGPCDREQSELRKKRGSKTQRQALRRVVLKCSCTNATDTSPKEMVDVRAATIRSRKNRADHREEAGSCANTSGKVTNTSVAP